MYITLNAIGVPKTLFVNIMLRSRATGYNTTSMCTSNFK